MRNTKRLHKLDEMLRPLQKEYAKKAWRIARKIYDVSDHEQRRLAFSTVCGVDLAAAFELAAITPPSRKIRRSSKSTKK